MATPRSGRSVLVSPHLTRAAVTLVTLLAGATGLLALSPSAPAAPPASNWHGHVPKAAPPGAGQAQIVGVVTDEAAHAVDNISVVAYPVVHGARGKVPAASDLTYEGPGHHHGFYRLHVPAGRYVVVFATGPRARTSYRLQKYTGTVTAPSRRVVALHTVAMVLTKKATATVTLTVFRNHNHASLSVTSTWVKPVLGRVVLVELRPHGRTRTLVAAHLNPHSKGHLRLKFATLGRGRHVLVAEYLGAKDLKPASTRLVVTVVT